MKSWGPGLRSCLEWPSNREPAPLGSALPAQGGHMPRCIALYLGRTLTLGEGPFLWRVLEELAMAPISVSSLPLSAGRTGGLRFWRKEAFPREHDPLREVGEGSGGNVQAGVTALPRFSGPGCHPGLP